MCGFLLSGSALGEEKGATWEKVGLGRLSEWYVVLVVIEFCPERKNGEEFGVCLNIYMQGYNWGYVFERTVPKYRLLLCHARF